MGFDCQDRATDKSGFCSSIIYPANLDALEEKVPYNISFDKMKKSPFRLCTPVLQPCSGFCIRVGQTSPLSLPYPSLLFSTFSSPVLLLRENLEELLPTQVILSLIVTVKLRIKRFSGH